MWPVSQHFLDTLARSHTQLSYVDVLRDGDVIATLTGGVLVDPGTGLPTQNLGGSIQVDRATIMRSATLTFQDVSGQLTPNSVADLFAHLITEIRVWMGVRYWDAPLAAVTVPPALPTIQTDTEYVPVGTFVITDVAVDYPQLTITGLDRMCLLQPFTSPFKVTFGDLMTGTIQRIISSQVPAARRRFNFPQDIELTSGAQLLDTNTSSADSAHNHAQAIGQMLYVDPMGVFVMTDEPSTDDDAVLDFVPGIPGVSVMMRPRREIDASNAVNAVVVTGEASDTPPVRGYAQDNNPSSMTYAPTVGVRPLFVSSPLVRTAAQANQMAKATLRKVVGLSDAISLSIVPNPALASGDVVTVTDPQQGLDHMPVIIDSFTLPLRASDGVMTCSCRARVIR